MSRFVFLFTSMRDCSFSPTSEFTGLSIEAKCDPVKKYKRAREKHMSESVKSPYEVGHYCDMAVSPTRSHLLWWYLLLCFSAVRIGRAVLAVKYSEGSTKINLIYFGQNVVGLVLVIVL